MGASDARVGTVEDGPRIHDLIVIVAPLAWCTSLGDRGGAMSQRDDACSPPLHEEQAWRSAPRGVLLQKG